MTDDQQGLVDLLSNTLVAGVTSVGARAATDDGRLIGPFNPALYSPAISAKFVELQMFELMHTSLPERVRQVVILAVGAIWRADYELYAHSAAARAAGLSAHAVAALAHGDIPDELTEDEKIAGELARQLSSTHHVDDTLYREAENAFGQATSRRYGRPHRRLPRRMHDPNHVRGPRPRLSHTPPLDHHANQLPRRPGHPDTTIHAQQDGPP